MLRRPLAAAAAAVAVALSAGAARAQDTPVDVRSYRFTVEGLVSQGYFNDDLVGSDKQSLGGFGARIMFNHSTPANLIRSFTDRASVGAFFVRTNGQGALDVSTTHVGVQADVSMFPRAAYRGTLDPFFSLGVGALRTGVPGGSNTDLAVTPAIGTRLSLITGFGLRGDLRAPIVFGNSTTINAVAEGGVFVSF